MFNKRNLFHGNLDYATCFLLSGTTICLHNILDFCLHKLQWSSVSVRHKLLFLSRVYIITTQWSLPLYDGRKKRYLCLLYMCYSREFTHRVKSISMAKFSAEEVSALQAAGNEVPSLYNSYLLGRFFILSS